MRVVKREDILVDNFQEIFNKESHHDHEVVETKRGVLRWKENPIVNFLVDIGDLNKIIRELDKKGYGKNSEIYRKLYRDMGYSLGGYWEVFYWAMNNENTDEYRELLPDEVQTKQQKQIKG